MRLDHGPGAVAAAIIAGGQGRRLGGRVKALIEVDGETILAMQVRLLRSVVDGEVLISANDAAPFSASGLRVIGDEVMDAGPLAGLVSTLAAAKEAWVLCVASDMPRLSAAVLRVIVDSRRSGVDAVIPVIGGRPEPLCALYGQSALAVMRDRLNRGERSLRRLVDCGELVVRTLTEADLTPLDPTLSTFTNVNLPVDLG